MKKILLILTGGTIGSCENNGIISAAQTDCRVLEMYRNKFPADGIEFVTEKPYNILSEDLFVGNWEKLIRFIINSDLSGFDGIIITHGSDTLSYSSAMLGLCLNNIGLPVVITASDYVPDDKRSNALINFKACVDLILQSENGVYTVYKNKTDKYARIFIPTRLCEADRINDVFTSCDDLPPVYINEKGMISGDLLSDDTKHDMMPGLSDIDFRKSVLLVHPYPSLEYKSITIPENAGAVLHITYHSGTVSEKALFLLERCRERGLPMFLCSLKSNNNSIYETSDILLKNGAIPVFDTGNESAYAKLLLAVNLYPDDIAGFMRKNIYHEII